MSFLFMKFNVIFQFAFNKLLNNADKNVLHNLDLQVHIHTLRFLNLKVIK